MTFFSKILIIYVVLFGKICVFPAKTAKICDILLLNLDFLMIVEKNVEYIFNFLTINEFPFRKIQRAKN